MKRFLTASAYGFILAAAVANSTYATAGSDSHSVMAPSAVAAPADTVRTLDEVVVTGSNTAVPQRLLPYTVSVIGQRQLDAAGETQVLSVLSGIVPSLFVSQRSVFRFGVSNGGAGHIKLRGVGGDRASAVLMMVDGQPQFAGIYSHHIADFYDKEYTDRVEVLRGPGSVLYGSNAMAGTINVITKNAKSDGVHTTLRSQYGSYNTWLSSATNMMRFGRFSSLVSLSYNRTDGTVDNFDFRQADGYAKVGYDFSLHCSTSGTARIYYSYGNHFVDDPRHFHSKDDRFGMILYQNFHPWKDASATVGFDFDSYSGEIPVSGGNHHTEGSITTLARKSITEYSPYVVLSQSLCAEMVKGNLSMGYRNPSFRELYLYRMANPDLQPEKMMNYEVSVSRTFSRYLSAELTAYYSKGDNLIQTVDMKNQNTGRFINKGIELSAHSRPLGNLWITATYSYLHTSLRNLAGAPRNQYFLGLEWKPWRILDICADLKGVGGLYVAENISRQNYAVLDLKVSCDLCRYVTVFTRLENLTDARYMINRGYDMPGFTAMGGFKLRF